MFFFVGLQLYGLKVWFSGSLDYKYGMYTAYTVSSESIGMAKLII